MGEETASASGSSAVIAHAARGVRHLVSLQLVTRALTFLLNVLVVRRVDRAVTGTAGVQLQLVLALSLALSRDVARRLYARIPFAPHPLREPHNSRPLTTPAPSVVHSEQESRYVVNAAWVSVAVAALFSVPLATAWALLTRPAAPDAPAGYAAAVLVFAGAALLEALAEPLAARALAAQHYRTRLRVEGAAAVVRCALSYALVAAVCPRAPALTPLVALALGQLAFGATLVAGYGIASWRRKKRDKTQGGGVWVARPVLSGALWRLLGAYAWQAAQKVVLQEGEKLVLAVCGAARAVGADVAAVYAVVNNLASLVVRFVFLPLEEVCFTAFGKLAAAGDARAAARVLRAVLRFAVLVGLAFVAFGPGYARAVVHVVYGAKYSATAAPTVLAWYCVYILFLALNGTSEAFVHSVASEAQLRANNLVLVAFSVLFVAASAVLLRIPGLAAVGLVLANCFSLFPSPSSIFLVSSRLVGHRLMMLVCAEQTCC